MRDEKKTYEVEEFLKNMKPNQLDTFYKENNKYMNDQKAFYYYMKDVLESKNIQLKKVYKDADVTEKYGGKIIRMEKHTKNRDLIIRFCLAGRFSLDETNKALKLYKMNQLYAKEKRDFCIIVAINNRKYELTEVNEMLEKHGFTLLSKNDE